MAGLEDALAYARGERSRGVAHAIEVPEVDVRGARQARSVAIEVRRDVAGQRRDRAQLGAGRRRPEGPARVLLTVIDREPDAVRRALAG